MSSHLKTQLRKIYFQAYSTSLLSEFTSSPTAKLRLQFFFFFNIYLFSTCVLVGEWQREKERIRIRLCDDTEAAMGLKFMSCENMTQAKVGSLTDWVTQVPWGLNSWWAVGSCHMGLSIGKSPNMVEEDKREPLRELSRWNSQSFVI